MEMLAIWVRSSMRVKRLGFSSLVSPISMYKEGIDYALLVAKTICPICSLPLLSAPPNLILLFLCRHVVHVGCVKGGEDLRDLPDAMPIGMSVGVGIRGIGGKIA
jgi:hypothetical protein